MRACARGAVCCAVVMVVLSLLSAPVLAQGDAKAMAEALFKDGRRLMDEKNYAEACPKFEESHNLEAKVGTLLNMAICHEKQGKTASAWAEFTEVASQSRQRNDPERADFATEQVALLEPKLSKLVVQSEHPYDEITITIDGNKLRRAGHAVASRSGSSRDRRLQRRATVMVANRHPPRGAGDRNADDPAAQRGGCA